MSRRHASSLHSHLRLLVVALSLALLAGVAVPGSAFAQGSDRTRALEHEWQVLTYRSAGASAATSDLEPVPAGVGATLLLFGQKFALGDAACSSYETTYNVQGKNLFIDPAEPEYVECDPASRAFDEVFYELLQSTASFELTSSLLVLKDSIGEHLMAFTRARIDEDPTAARWDLARIGEADGSVEPVIAGLNPWIEFLRGGSVVGNTGCGSFFGSYATDDGTIDISDVRYRLVACADGPYAQAEKIIATLDDIARFQVLPAGLRLQDENGTTRLALTPVIELNARTWTPTAIFDGRDNVVYEGQVLSTSAVKLQADDADGGTICGPFEAKATRDGLALSIRNPKLVDRKKSSQICKTPKNPNKVDLPAVENAFLDALKATASHALRGSELEFKDVDGNTVMRLEPQAELIGPTWVVDWLGRRSDKPVGNEPLTATFTDSGLVLGETGVVRNGMTNFYEAYFDTPQATRIRVEDVSANEFCRGKQKQRPICKQEASFLTLLGEADRYIAREGDLKLYRGTDAIMSLVPDYLITNEE